MIIHQPELIQKNDKTIVFSKIEFDQPRENMPEYLWYRVPNRFADAISTQSDAFLTAGLLGGMQFNEDIDVRGTVSPKLAYNLPEYLHILNFRMPKFAKKINIKYQTLSPEHTNPDSVALAFSGGVDSLFAIWDHLPAQQPDRSFQITHGIHISGYDSFLSKKESHQRYFEQSKDFLNNLGIDLIPLETNIVRLVVPYFNFVHFYSPILASCGQILGGKFNRYYVGSSKDYHQLNIRASSSSPLTDKLLSTDTLDIVHHGATHKRVEKVLAISDWEVAQKNLRVCFHKNDIVENANCSRCEKCVRTMLPLYSLGKMDKFVTFSKPFKRDIDSLWLARKFFFSPGYLPETFTFVYQQKPKMIGWLAIGAVLGISKAIIFQLIPNFVKKWLNRFGHFMPIVFSSDNYENEEIVDSIVEWEKTKTI